jgi:hypothetical protein
LRSCALFIILEAIGRKTGNHPRIKSEGVLLPVALDAGCFILDVRQTARLIRNYK